MKNYVYNNNLCKTGEEFAWEGIPDEVWAAILENSIALGLNGFGLEAVESLNEVNNSSLLNCLISQGLVEYNPYHKGNPKNILKFKLSHNLISELKKTSIQEWGAENVSLPYDEIVFFNGDVVKILIIPYDGFVFFENMGEEELEKWKMLNRSLANGIRLQ